MNFNKEHKEIMVFAVIIAFLLAIFSFIELTSTISKFWIPWAVFPLLILLGYFFLRKSIPDKSEIHLNSTHDNIKNHFESSNIISEDINTEHQLSSREIEVLQMASEGYSNKEIADKLHVSLSTVKTHLSNVFYKLEGERRTMAIKKGRELKLIK